MTETKKPKVVFVIPTLTKPFPENVAALEASVPLLDAAGIDHSVTWEVGCPYISHARSTMIHRALKNGADMVVCIDHDLSWKPESLLKLIQTDGDVVAGTYRYKEDTERYMGTVFANLNAAPFVRTSDGALRGEMVPAGFLKITRNAVEQFARSYPELLYGSILWPEVDLFNHGARDFVWWGEDYSFSRRWRECGGDIWLVPDLDITHHTSERAYPGNFYRFIRRQPEPSAKAA